MVTSNNDKHIKQVFQYCFLFFFHFIIFLRNKTHPKYDILNVLFLIFKTFFSFLTLKVPFSFLLETHFSCLLRFVLLNSDFKIYFSHFWPLTHIFIFSLAISLFAYLTRVETCSHFIRFFLFNFNTRNSKLYLSNWRLNFLIRDSKLINFKVTQR